MDESVPLKSADVGPLVQPQTPPNGRRDVGPVEFLRKVELFKRLDYAELEHLGHMMRSVRLGEGQIIRDTTRDTASVDGLYLIKSGVARVTRSSESWEAEAVLAILRQGDCFGEIGLIDGLPPSANVTAMESMECYFLPREAFLAELEKNPKIALGMLAAWAPWSGRRTSG